MSTSTPRSPRAKFSAKLHSLMLALPIVTGTSLLAQTTSTWLTNAAGNTTWSTASWSGGVPVSSTGTTVNFFTANTTVSAGTNIAFNDITPMVVNQLNISGVGGATAGVLTLQGSGITFDGTSPQLNINPAYGSGGGYTFNLAAPVTFIAPTTITLGGGGGFINTTSANVWNGSGNVTLTGSLTNRPLSLTGTAGTFTGDLTLSGNTTVLQLNGLSNSLGTSNSTQSLIVGSGSGVNINYNNGAHTNSQNFILNGNGNAGTSNAALNVTRIGFGNGPIGALAIASNSTVRVQMETASEARAITLFRGLVGTGDLTKNGNGYLLINAFGGNVTWGGNTYNPFSGNITINEGAIQTPGINFTLGNTTVGANQTVLVKSGAAFVHGSGDNAWQNPQNFVINGSGTGYVANTGGYAAYTTATAGFGSNRAGSLTIQSDSVVAVNKNTGRGSSGFQIDRGLFGSGTLIISNNYGNTVGPMYVGNATTANVTTTAGTFDRFSGKVVLNNGILITTGSGALGDATSGQVYLSGLGGFGSNGISLNPVNQAFLDRISNLATTSGTLLLGASNSNNLDFTAAPNLRLGAIASANGNGASSTGYTYSGTLTPGANGYRLGGAGGGILTVSSNLTDSNALNIGGAVTLTGAGNTFSGGITIAGIQTNSEFAARLNYTNGTGVLPSSNNLTFAGTGGTFAYATPINTTETSQSLGNLTFSEGLGSVTATTGNATVFGTSTLTFANLTRSAGAAATLQTVNGVNGTSNKIVITSLGTTPGFVNKGVFYNTSNYAFNDAAGFLRAPVYGTDTDFVTSGTTATVGSVAHLQITGNITAQNTATFTTLRLSGNAPLNLASGQIVTVEGILKAGGTAINIAGGTGIQASSGGELVINNADNITLSTTPILDNSSSSLTKLGAGSLTLSAAGNTYAGGTTVAQGTLVVASTSGSGLADTSPVVVNGGTYNSNVADTIGALTLRNGIVGGIASVNPASADLQNGGVIIPITGTTAVTKTTEGYVYLSANNTYSGGTTVSAGSVSLIGLGTFGTGTLTISGGRVDLGGKTITNTLGPITGGGSLHNGVVSNNGGTYELQNGTITAVLAGTNGLNKTSNGTLTLSSNNTYSGTTTISEGSLVLGATTLPSGGLGASKVVLTSGSTFDVSGVTASPITLSGGLGGNGTVNAGGKNLLVAGSFTPGALAISGNLSFDPATLTTFVASTTPGVSTALAVTGSVTNAGNLTITAAPGFTFAGNQSFTFVTASGNITSGYAAVTANNVALAESPEGTWSATGGGLIYTYTESTATLNVTSSNTAPTISDITNLSIPSGTSTPAVPFTVGDAETAAGLLTLSATSSNPSLVPNGNIVFGGSGANRTVTVTPISGNTGTATITVTVTDDGSPALSNITPETFVLTVTDSFVSWAKSKGIEGQPATGDFDGDGISNLMEYALNGNPTAADTSILPQITGTGPLKLTFYRNGDANITYIVEARDDLVTGSWVEKYNSFGTTYTPGLFEVTDSGQVGNKRFMRLRVTTP